MQSKVEGLGVADLHAEIEASGLWLLGGSGGLSKWVNNGDN